MLVYLNYVNGSPRQTQRKALNFLSWMRNTTSFKQKMPYIVQWQVITLV